ncbi:hypothetical protein ACFL23_02050 [Patescibacteria group bacterium]
MTKNELKILEVIWDWGGEASVSIIASEVRISIDYTRSMCKSLQRENYIDFLRSKSCKIKAKGKLAVKGKIDRKPSKIVIPQVSWGSHFKDKSRVLNYG